jgi:hypothetical protein
MIVSVPASTVLTLPETGQSRNPAAALSTARPTRSTVRGSIVLTSIATADGPMPSTIPSGLR